MAIDPTLHLSASLAKRPELAKEIGLLISDYAVLELLLWEVYIALTTGPPEDTFSTFFGMRSINNKTKLISDAIQTWPPLFRRAAKRLIRRMKGAAARRTEIAHVHIQDVGGEPVRIHLYGQSARVTKLDDAFLVRTVNQFRTLAADLVTFVVILGLGNTDRLIAKSKAARAELRRQLQGPPRPQESPRRRSAAEQAASLSRLGLSELEGKTWALLRPKKDDFGPAPYRYADILVFYDYP